MKHGLLRRALVLTWFLVACDAARDEAVPDAAVVLSPLARSSARLTHGERAPLEVHDVSRDTFGAPLPGLSERERARFFVGNSYFNQNWVSAPSSVPSRDGLGPLFNARSCSGCHFKDGRGRAPEPGQPVRTALVRLSVPDTGATGAPKPEPTYGEQLQGDAVTGIAREADVFVRYHEQPGQFVDGSPYSLRVPRLEITGLGHGPLADDVLTSLRSAPALVGMGLLEAVPESDLLARVDADDRDGDGISGRANRVVPASTGLRALGRFGWKAEQATVLDQTAAAFVGDMGITSRLFVHENHTPAQEACADAAGGGEPELDDAVLDSVVLYVRTLAVPARRERDVAEVLRGEHLFAIARCTACHTPKLTTALDVIPAELAGRTIHPFTDLLLHDMGPGLADGRPSVEASGSEWRTAPLWGIGLVERVSGGSGFLHDGRARDLQEAVLWHAGEAEAAKQSFVRMRADDRRALIHFLESL